VIVRSTQEITGTERDIESEDGSWRSKRIVLGGDRVGFSFHETTIKAGTVNNFHYANHIEAVWLIEGEGTLTDRETGEEYEIGPGSMYLLDGNERHTVAPRTQMRMM
jgi:L-ectoine synthase